MKARKLALLMFFVLLLLVDVALIDHVSGEFSLSRSVRYFGFGILAGILLLLIFPHSELWNTFWHELTHLLWAKVFKAQVGTIMVSRRRGGYVSHSGAVSWGLIFVALAPYFFPTVPMLLVLLKLFFKSYFHYFVNFAIGLTLFWFYWDTVQTLRTPQSDIAKIGLGLSVVVILSLHVFFLCLLLLGVLDASLLTAGKAVGRFWLRIF